MNEEKVYCSMYSRNAELYHHGIKGQKWGVHNGPPYPLDSDVSTGKRLKNFKETKTVLDSSELENNYYYRWLYNDEGIDDYDRYIDLLLENGTFNDIVNARKYGEEQYKQYKNHPERLNEEKLLNDQKEEIQKYGDYEYKYTGTNFKNLKHVYADRAEGDAIWDEKHKSYSYNMMSTDKSLKYRKNEEKILKNLSENKIIEQLAKDVYDGNNGYYGKSFVKEWAGEDISRNNFKNQMNISEISFAYWKNKPIMQLYTNSPDMFGGHGFVIEYDLDNNKIIRTSFEG